MKRFFLVGILMLMLCSTVVSAALTVTDNYPGWGVTGTPPAVSLTPWKTIDRGLWLANPVVNFTVSDAPSGTYRYRVMLGQFFNDASFPINTTDATFSGAAYVGTGSGNHTYQVTLNTSEFLYDNISYVLQIFVWRTGVFSAWNMSYLNMTGAGETGLFVHFSDSDPPYLDLHGFRAVGRGMQFLTSGLEFATSDPSVWVSDGALQAPNIQLTVLVTDNTSSHRLICRNTFNINYQQSGRETIADYITNMTFHFGVLPMLTAGEGKAFFKARTSYYVFVGINNTAGNHVTADDSFLLTSFSIADYNAGTRVYPDLSKAHKFDGVYTYFETFPKTGETGGWVQIGRAHV